MIAKQPQELSVVDNALVLPKLECHAPIVLEYENET